MRIRPTAKCVDTAENHLTHVGGRQVTRKNKHAGNYLESLHNVLAQRIGAMHYTFV
ncbi:MAG TPA: hypothetical protein PK156_22900 [Polyangium sp.]|nr:hypothetical protein [Polyangium sp.]